jgi:hypothetical protein
MYLSSQGENLCGTTDIRWHELGLGIPDLQGTVCMLDISQLVLSLGHELSLSIGCSAPLESLVMKKISRAICTVSRIALAARMVSSTPETAHASQPLNDTCEERFLLCNDMRVLSVALSRAAIELSRRIASAVPACPQSRAIVQELCLLSRTASTKAREVSAQAHRR